MWRNPSDPVAGETPLEALRAADVDYRASLSEIGGLIARLAAEEPVPAMPCPDSVRLEVEIALDRPFDKAEVARLGEPTTLTCPDGGGVLMQIRRSPPSRFRCQVGRAFAGGALEGDQKNARDDAMRAQARKHAEVLREAIRKYG